MYHCKIYHSEASIGREIILLDIIVDTLKDLAIELDMSYQQVADINSRVRVDLTSRKRSSKYNYKYFPKIEITKISKDNVTVSGFIKPVEINFN